MNNQFHLSPLESEVLRVIRNAGLQVHLWFPIVQRGVLALRSDASDEQVHAAVVALARQHAITDIETGCLNPPNWVATAEVRDVAAVAVADHPISVHEDVQADVEGPRISLLEAQIILTIDHIGWYAYLWFPTIQRGLMNLSSDEAEEKVHATLVGLIRKGALVITKESEEYPRWNQHRWLSMLLVTVIFLLKYNSSMPDGRLWPAPKSAIVELINLCNNYLALGLIALA
jgi:hypothetical protein